KDYQTLLSQLEHAFNTLPQFGIQKLWFYTMTLIYQLILELPTTDDGDASASSSASSSDPE
ncbi:hypothetical protein DFJ58DRAFT_819743, partial [Suillus subalutaceus]|uniref:uncharacterized protein n=1 Tax=Suillus subalutaceus TaxID=48586 RepID=UPI001B86EDE6